MRIRNKGNFHCGKLYTIAVIYAPFTYFLFACGDTLLLFVKFSIANHSSLWQFEPNAFTDTMRACIMPPMQTKPHFTMIAQAAQAAAATRASS